MNANIRFEIKAAAFNRMTGMLPPGKDDPFSSDTREERECEWIRWNDENGSVIDAMMQAVEKVLI